MKSLKYILSAGIACTLLTACNDSFLDRFPETNLNEETFFQNPKDLEIYANGFYDDLMRYGTDDLYSDNIGGYSGTSEFDNLLRGNINAENVGGWSQEEWGKLRKVNLLIADAYKAKGDPGDINHYVGVARFFRAQFYFNQIRRYGFAPWYSRPLKTSDTELLYKGQDSRELIADSIMADLQYAITYIKPITSRTYVNQWAAYASMARFALYEGSFRKYHPEVKLTESAGKFYEKAIWAANEVMKSGLFEITGEGAEGYRNLFCSGDLSKNKEMLLYADYDKVIGRSNNTSVVLDWQWNLSKSLADSYLKIDGTPATADPDYKTRLYTEIFEGRDLRMAETIMPAGFVMSGDKLAHKTKPDFGNLPQLKFYPRTPELNNGYDSNYTDLPIFRYAEILLIYAEAKAELGTILQTDINATINLLRNRAGVDAMQFDALAIDPVLAAQYPNVVGTRAATILEIRRERRVELACESFRYDDLMRWKAGKLMEAPAEGIYIPKFGAYDITGDGQADIAILRTPTEHAGLTEDELKTLNIYTLIDKDGKESNFYLSEGDKGNIRFVKDKNLPRKFEDPKYYYFPIPAKQFEYNTNLKQPLGW